MNKIKRTIYILILISIYKHNMQGVQLFNNRFRISSNSQVTIASHQYKINEKSFFSNTKEFELSRNSTKCWYQSHFNPINETANKILTSGQILGHNEKPHQMIERIVNTIVSAEELYKQLHHQNMIPLAKFANQLGELMDNRSIVFSTPILTNAGRFNNRPLSACAMPPIDLKSDLTKIKQIVDQYHQDGMGTGYDLSDSNTPISTLKYLNKIAVEGAQSNKEQRPVGNMAILDVHSPNIEEFVMVKVGADNRKEDWKFNISVNITESFMDAVQKNQDIVLRDGKKISAKNLFSKMAYAAHQCGDPGLISIERLNADNPTPFIAQYKSTAPCAEVGLAPGETCVFGYINLAEMVNQTKCSMIDFDRLRTAVRILTRALDNILEISIDHYSFAQSKRIMQAKRKIGIGICGFADMLIKLNYSYKEKKSQDLLTDVLNFISYHSKEASIELARYRGSFNAIANSRYMDESFIMNKYGIASTPNVSIGQWLNLAKNIKQTRLLRNATLTALPPTGRSALIIGASMGIEPIFSFYTSDGIYPALSILLKKRFHFNNSDIIQQIKETGCCPKSIIPTKHNPYVTATEIEPKDHLAMTIAAQKVIDESISKTINLPEKSSPEEIEQIYMNAYKSGLKGISVYRHNSRILQPKELSKPSNN